MKFFPSSAPLNDFVVTFNLTTFAEKKLPETVDKVALSDNQILFYTNGIFRAPQECLLFSGFCLERGRYITNFQDLLAICDGDLTAANSLIARGNWVCLVHVRGKTEIRCDAFGLCPIYYFLNGKIGAVSNRFHLLLDVLKSAGISLSRNYDAALPMLCPFYFGEQLCTRETTVKGVFLLQAQDFVMVDKTIEVKNDAVYKSYFSSILEKSYDDLVLEASNSICQDVSTLASNATCFLALSGGQDSRAVYAALIKEELLRHVYLLTAPNAEKDLKIVCGITNIFGGKFGECVFYDKVAGELEEIIKRFRSFNLGLYSYPQCLGGYYSPASHAEVVRLVGGGGECYRNYYSNYLGLSESSDWAKTRTAIEGHFEKWFLNSGIGRGYFQEASEILMKELRSFDCENIVDSLDWHYLNYRNRFHFGNKSLRFSIENFLHHPLMQPALLGVGKLLSYDQRVAGRVIFDLTTLLVGFLARLDYDAPEKAFSTKVIEQSSFNNLPLELRITMDFSDENYKKGMKQFQSIRSKFQLEGPTRFTRKQKESVLKNLLATSFDYLSEDVVMSSFLTAEFRDWLLQRVDRRRMVGTVPIDHKFTCCLVGLHDTWRLISA